MATIDDFGGPGQALDNPPLGGPSGWAKAVRDAIRNLEGGGVDTTALADGAVTSAKIADGTIATGDIADQAVTAAKIANDTITAAQIAANAVGSSELADNAVDTNAIADSAVTSAKIADGTIATGDIADQAVTAAKIANDTITAAQIAANAVGSSELADNGVDTAAIQAGAVTTAKLADAAVTAAKLSAGLGGLLTTKGDLVARDASTAVRLPVGADGTVLQADAGSAAGMRWSPTKALSGTGTPEGVIAAAPGSTFLQTDSTVDVKGWIRWVKATGTGNTGWVAGPEADTGWRDVTASAGALHASNTGTLKLARRGRLVIWALDNLLMSAATGPAELYASIPAGFRSDSPSIVLGTCSRVSNLNYRQMLSVNSYILNWHAEILVTTGAGTNVRPSVGIGGQFSYEIAATTAWPSSLPGSAA